ncbi:aspartic peptidase domain-containing protein [Mycena leptocephala]|nr:aspartic peptidase domain-containing protein [Mycena leptocephala]
MMAIFFILLILPTFCASDPLHIPLTRATGTRTLEANIADADRMRIRYGFSSASRQNNSNERRAFTQTVPIGDQGIDDAYYATISIGTPGQLFDVQLELSASDAWVVDTTCVDGCTNSMQVYDPSFSSTANIQSTSGGLTFGSYTASGNIMQDTMQLGSYMVQSQVFLSAKHISAKWITGPVSGSLGLGFGGDLAPRVQQWKLSLKGMTVQGKPVPITPGDSSFSIFDLNNALIGGPTSDVEAIWAAVPGSKPISAEPGAFQFPCNTSVNITVSFGGRSWSISPLDINLGPTELNGSQCFGAIVSLQPGNTTAISNGSPNWVFGTSFLTKPISIGFAQLSSSGPTPRSSTLSAGSATIPEPSYQTLSLPAPGPTRASVPVAPIVGVLALILAAATGISHFRVSALEPEIHAPRSDIPVPAPSPTMRSHFQSFSVPTSGASSMGLNPHIADMKREQTANVLSHGATHIPSDVLVHTPGGLRLSPVLEQPGSLSPNANMHTDSDVGMAVWNAQESPPIYQGYSTAG